MRERSAFKGIVIAIAVLITGMALLMLIGGNADAAILVVDDTAGGWRDHSTIQAAINAASAGDEIHVYAGTYNENVVVDEEIELKGNGSATTIIDGGDAGDVMSITANNVLVWGGFNISDGGDDVDPDPGSSVRIYGNNVTLTGCIFHGSSHGVYFSGKESEVQASRFHYNIRGAIIRNEENEILTSNFTSNVDNVNIYVNSNGSDVVNCELNGGIYGVYVSSDHVSISSCTIWGAEYGIDVAGVKGLNVRSTTVKKSTKHGMRFMNTATQIPLVNNSMITGSTVYDASLYSADVIFMDTTFRDGGYLLVNSTSTLWLKQWLHVKVKTDNGDPVDSADVRITEGTTNLYKTHGYGGGDPVTNNKGNILPRMVAYGKYDASSQQTAVNSSIDAKKEGWSESRAMNMSSTHTETFTISTAIASLSVGQPLYNDGSNLWVTDATPFNLSSGTPGAIIQYRVWYQGNWTSWSNYTGNFTLTGECIHHIEHRAGVYYGVWSSVTNQTFNLDLTKPRSGIAYTGVFITKAGYFITNTTLITLSGADEGCNGGSGTDSTWYRIWYNGSWTGWTEYSYPFMMGEECIHHLEYYSVDNLNNVEDTINETYYVDLTPPSSTKTIGGPKYWDVHSQAWWVNHTTPFNLSATDAGCNGGVGVKNIWYRIGLWDEWTFNYTWTNWTKYTGDFNISEDCEHVIEWYAQDWCLNNETVNTQTHYVDGTPPETSKSWTEPFYEDYENGILWVTDETEFSFTPWDSGCQGTGVGANKTYYRIWYNGTWSGWTEFNWTDLNESFTLNGECIHYIEWYSIDLLGNKEPTQNETDYVDLTPPNTTKTIGSPQMTRYAGNPVDFGTSPVLEVDMTYDTINDRTVTVYLFDSNGTTAGAAHVSRVLGTRMIYGPPQSFYNGNIRDLSITTAVSGNSSSIVITYSDLDNYGYGTAVVGNLVGNTITFGSPTVFTNASVNNTAVCYDTVNSTLIIAYTNQSSGNSSMVVLGTITGALLSFGEPTQIDATTTWNIDSFFDIETELAVFTYISGGLGMAMMGHVNGTSGEITLGPAAPFEIGGCAAVDARPLGNGLFLVAWINGSGGGLYRLGSHNGAQTISFTATQVFDTGPVLDVDVISSTVTEDFFIFYELNSGTKLTRPSMDGPAIDIGMFFDDSAPAGQYEAIFAFDANTGDWEGDIVLVAAGHPTGAQARSKLVHFDGEKVGTHWVTGRTIFNLNGSDEGCEGGVGTDVIYYRIYWRGRWTDWIEVRDYGYGQENASGELEVNFSLRGDCKHILEWYSVDLLNNSETVHNQTHYVDNTPPEISKTIGSPKYWYQQYQDLDTFWYGDYVIPFDEHQADIVKAFGFVQEVLSAGGLAFRIIEKPDITLRTNATPSGELFTGGPIIIPSWYWIEVEGAMESFENVTVLTLQENFTWNKTLTLIRDTNILIINGTWGHTYKCLDDMGLPYELVERWEFENDTAMAYEYDLIVVDCEGWVSMNLDSSTMPANVSSTLENFAYHGGELIFTDIALLNMEAMFPDYVDVVTNVDTTHNFTFHNTDEFPSQYYGRSPLDIYTMVSGQIIGDVYHPDVKVMLDTDDYPYSNEHNKLDGYAAAAVYWQYGAGIVEAFAYHPPEQTPAYNCSEDSYNLSCIFYGNKFIHAVFEEGHWEVNLSTLINLTAVDEGCDGGVGLDYMEYRIYWNGSWSAWTTYVGDFNFTEECYHILEARAYDALGNVRYHNQTMTVDETPPVSYKVVGQPNLNNGSIVGPNTEFNLTAVDFGCQQGGVGISAIWYRVWYNGTWKNWTKYAGNFTMSGDCTHYLEWYAVDNLGNKEAVRNQTHYVDATPPDSMKTITGPHVRRPVGDVVTYDTDVNDHDAVAVGDNKFVIAYTTYYNGTTRTLRAIVGWVDYDTPYYGTPIELYNGSTGKVLKGVVFDSVNDRIIVLYNEIVNGTYTGYVRVGEVSGITISFGSPVSLGNGSRILSAVSDPTTGTVLIAYRNEVDLNGKVVVGNVSGMTISFGTPTTFHANATGTVEMAVDTDDGGILICYMNMTNVTNTRHYALVGLVNGSSVDLGDIALVQNQSLSRLTMVYDPGNDAFAIAFTESLNPAKIGKVLVARVNGTAISFGTPSVFHNADLPDQMLYTLRSAFDPVNNKFIITYASGGTHTVTMTGNVTIGQISGMNINIGPPVSYHVYHTVDAPVLYLNDHGGFVIAWRCMNSTNQQRGESAFTRISGFKIAEEIIWVNQTTMFNLTAIDSGCNGGSGISDIWYRIWYNESWTQWTNDTGNFSLSGECKHIIQWYAVDRMGNNESPHTQVHYVDLTPPVTQKYMNTAYVHGMYIRNDTFFLFRAIDWGCNLGVGVKYTKYRIWYNGSWSTWTRFNRTRFYMPEECVHHIQWYSVDKLGNKEVSNNQTHYVDRTPPVSEKDIGLPHYGNNSLWVNSSSKFTLTAEDYGCMNGSGVGSIYYRIWWNGSWTNYYPSSGGWQRYTGPFNFTEECLHYLEWYAVDMNNNREAIRNQTHYVDLTAPTTTVNVTGPQYGTSPLWITESTVFTLNGSDSGCMGGVGLDGIMYRIWYNGTWDTWKLYTGPFTMAGECVHYLQWYGFDKLGNEEAKHNNTYYLDKTAPITNKSIGNPKFPYVYIMGGDPIGTWVTNTTQFNLSATDQGCQNGVGIDWTTYRIWYNGTWSAWLLYIGNFTMDGECTHILEWYSMDLLGNTETVNNQTHYVDNSPPVSTKAVGSPSYNGTWWVTSTTEFELTAEDFGCEESPAGIEKIMYRIWYNGTWSAWKVYNGSFSLQGDCIHYLEWYAIDYLGNKEQTHNQTHYVDNLAPVTTLSYSNPWYSDGDLWVNTDTYIYLNATDQGCNGTGVGVKFTKFKIWWDGEWSAWMNYTGPFQFTEECLHHLEWYSEDHLGNFESVRNQTFKVDSTYPIAGISISGPRSGDWATSSTEISLSAFDLGCDGGVGVSYLKYRIWYDGNWTPLLTHNGSTIYLAGECTHHLEGFAVDHLGNMEPAWNTTFYVDNTPPNTTKEFGWPRYDDGNITWLTSLTDIWINATDYGCMPNGSGVKESKYRVYYNNHWSDWTHITGSFTLNGECVHILEWYSVDNLGNNRTWNQTHYVDDTAPNATKEVGGPWYGTNYTWLNTNSWIYLNATDEGCQGGVGMQFIKYKYWYNGSWTGWITYTGPFRFYENCTHILEWYAMDKLGNSDGIHNWTHYVDDDSPITEFRLFNVFYTLNTHEYVIPTSSVFEMNGTDSGCNGGVGIGFYRFRKWYNGTWDPWLVDNTISITWSFSTGCTRIFEFQAIDRVGNTGQMVNVTVHVDVKPPITNLTTTGPRFGQYVTNTTRFHLNAVEQGCVNGTVVNETRYRVWHSGSWSGWTNYVGNFTLANECVHIIEWNSSDLFGNYETTHNQTFYVDLIGPTSHYSLNAKTYSNGTTSWIGSGATPYIVLLPSENGCNGGAGVNKSYYRIYYQGSWTNWTDYGLMINFLGDCQHTFEFYTVDKLGNIGVTNSVNYNYDRTRPNSTLRIGQPNQTNGLWITNQTPINISAVDYGCLGGSGVQGILYMTYYNGSWSTTQAYTGNFTLTNEGLHYIVRYAVDNVDTQELAQNTTHYVDLSAPETTKTITGTQYGQNGLYVTDTTLFNLTAVEKGPNGGVGVAGTWYRVWYNGSWTSWIGYTEPFYLSGNCTHILEYYSKDKLGNEEAHHNQTHKVNHFVPPTTVKTIIGPKHGQNDEYVLDTTIFNLTTINGSAAVNHTYYRIWYNGTWTNWTEYSGNFTLSGECTHYIEWYSVDVLGFTEATNNQTHYVDLSAPETIHTITGILESINDTASWVVKGTTLSLTENDKGCNLGSGVMLIYHRTWFNGSWTNWSVYSGDYHHNIEGKYHHEFRSVDNLGNWEDVVNETLIVDDSAPTTEITWYGNTFDDGRFWVGHHSANFTLTGTDQGPAGGVGLESTWVRIWDDGSWTSWMHTNSSAHTTLGLTPCMHHIEYGSMDKLGNNATIVNLTVYSDGSSPLTNMTVSAPNYGNGYWVSTSTNITLSANDTGCNGGVGVEAIRYRIWYNGSWTNWTDYSTVIQFSGDCIHHIEWYSIDRVGNIHGYFNRTFKVDGTAPTSVLTTGDPSYLNGTYVHETTEINLSATEAGCTGGVGLFGIYYRIWHMGSWTNATKYTENFTLSGECKHIIEWYSVDHLANYEAVNNKTIHVDLTAPTTTDDYDGKWHNTDVIVTLSANDAKSGVQTIYWRVDGGAWVAGGPAQVAAPADHGNDGNHTVDYYSVDQLGNTESTSSITVHIDTRPPELRTYFDVSSKKVKFTVVDDRDPSPTMVLTGKFGPDRIYRLTDDAGNVAIIKLRYKSQKIAGWKIRKVNYKWVSYNGGPQQSLAPAKFEIRYKAKKGTIRELKQFMNSGAWWIDGRYRRSTGQTRFKKFDGGLSIANYSGLRTADMRTNEGKMTYLMP